MEQGISVTAEEMIDQLLEKVTQLTMEVLAQKIVIRKLEEKSPSEPEVV